MDFPSLIDQLYRHGYKQADIRRMLKSEYDIVISQPTLHKIESGKTKDPRHSIGEAIVLLHHDLCAENLKSA